MAGLSMKQLDERLVKVEDALADLQFPEPPEAVSQEQLDDALKAIIVSLRQVRQQGAYNLAVDLENKYFDGQRFEHIGDVVTGMRV